MSCKDDKKKSIFHFKTDMNVRETKSWRAPVGAKIGNTPYMRALSLPTQRSTEALQRNLLTSSNIKRYLFRKLTGYFGW